jgi:DNA-directed RNA polymerase subunit E'
MYYKMRLIDTVRVPPVRLGEEVKDVVVELLKEKLEGKIDKRIGAVVSVMDVTNIGEGRILTGDGAVYYDVTFDAVVFRPQMQEIADGKIVEIVEFGAFVSIGPLDALLHVSQVTDDYMTYDEKNSKLISKDSGHSLTEGDALRGRIVAISLNEADPKSSKIGLTMRQPALGKIEWLEEERKKKEGAKK